MEPFPSPESGPEGGLAHEPLHTRPRLPERVSAGRTARKRLPRKTLGAWDPATRRDDPLAIIGAQDASRVHHLVPIRHGRMAASPFTYLRGAAGVMAADLASTPHSGLEVQLCGDAHLVNFGLWATPERNLSFDLRDFDETHPGPFEWDVKRLVASVVVAARDAGLADEAARTAARAAAHSYRERVLAFGEYRELEVWYDHIYVDEVVAALPDDRDVQLVTERGVARARRRTSIRAAAKLTEVIDGRRRIIDDPPLLEHLDDPEAEDHLREVFHAYRSSLQEDRRHLLERFHFVDAARKVVGVGSVGTRVFLLLLEGRDPSDLLFLQMKEAQASVLEHHLRPSRFGNHGKRVVSGQRLLQSASDIFLGWTHLGGHDFYMRQFRDMKAIPDTTRMNATQLELFAAGCGWVLARAHCRSGDAVALASYLGSSERFESSMEQFAVAYADQTEADHAQLLKAIERGEVEAEPGW